MVFSDYTSPDNLIICRGDRSCVHTYAITHANTYFGGRLATSNSIFISNGSVELWSKYYHFRGFYSGYNTIIICGYGHKCVIRCFGNACNFTTVKCGGIDSTQGDIANKINENTCEITYDCTYSQRSNFCLEGMV